MPQYPLIQMIGLRDVVTTIAAALLLLLKRSPRITATARCTTVRSCAWWRFRARLTDRAPPRLVALPHPAASKINPLHV
jgi:hypothetical protein